MVTENKDKIIVSNRLIAEFMGYTSDEHKYTSSYGKTFYSDEKGKRFCQISAMKYHTSWSWLMPVVSKLCEVITEHDQQFAGMKFFELGLFSELETVYSAAVEAINWYNAKQ